MKYIIAMLFAGLFFYFYPSKETVVVRHSSNVLDQQVEQKKQVSTTIKYKKNWFRPENAEKIHYPLERNSSSMVVRPAYKVSYNGYIWILDQETHEVLARRSNRWH